MGSISPNAKYKKIKGEIKIGSEYFSFSGKEYLTKGFMNIMNWLEKSDKIVPNICIGEKVIINGLNVSEGLTEPPDFMKEGDLVLEMEKNGIGTDASIPTHIKNIINRGYVDVQKAGRKLIPTKLGIALIDSYLQIDTGIVLPNVRANIENMVNQIAIVYIYIYIYYILGGG